MRRAAKVDANHGEIVAVFRACDCSVQSLAAIGKGCPDLLVGHKRKGNLLVEVKDGSKPPSKRKRSFDQLLWAEKWNCPVYVVTSTDEALNLVNT